MKWLPRSHFNPYGTERDHLPGVDLGRLAEFRHAIDLDHTAGHQLLAGAATVALAGEFKQLIEFDIVALKVKDLCGHEGKRRAG